MALNTTERLQEAFSLALEDRSRGYADLVSNSNAILHLMKKKNGFKKFSGPTIRERLLYNESNTYTRYSGYQLLNPRPAELFNDAEFIPKLAAVTITLSGEDILKNSGSNQLKDIMEEHIMAAEQELEDRFYEDLHSDGTADGGKQVTGLKAIIPTVADAGMYGGIDRAAQPLWRTKSYDISTDPFGDGNTTVTDQTIRRIMSNAIIQMTRGKRSPDCFAMSAEHYVEYEKSVQEIQRITDEGGLASRGFTSLKYHGGGRSVDVVLEGGIGSVMPANTTYMLDTKCMKFRYHPDRNFSKFGGKQMPVNQDAIVQHVGFFGNLTLNNPLHTGKFFG